MNLILGQSNNELSPSFITRIIFITEEIMASNCLIISILFSFHFSSKRLIFEAFGNLSTQCIFTVCFYCCFNDNPLYDSFFFRFALFIIYFQITEYTNNSAVVRKLIWILLYLCFFQRLLHLPITTVIIFAVIYWH